MRLRAYQAATLLAAVSILGCLDLTGADPQAPNAGELIDLPEPQRQGDVPVERALATRRSVREFAAAPLSLAALGQLAWAA